MSEKLYTGSFGFHLGHLGPDDLLAFMGRELTQEQVKDALEIVTDLTMTPVACELVTTCKTISGQYSTWTPAQREAAIVFLAAVQASVRAESSSLRQQVV